MASYSTDVLLNRARDCDAKAESAQRLSEARANDARSTADPWQRSVGMALAHIARLDALHEARKASLLRNALASADAEISKTG